MKKNFIISYCMMAVVLFFAVAITACESPEDIYGQGTTVDTTTVNPPEPPEPPEPEETVQIALDEEIIYFGSKAAELSVISVNITEWEVRNDDSWIHTEKRADNTLAVTVEPNRFPVDRAGTLTFVADNPEQGEATLAVVQERGKAKLYIRSLSGGIVARHCSENGRWIAGQKSTNSVRVEIEKLNDETYAGDIVNMPIGTWSVDNNGKLYANGCNADGTIYTDYEAIPAINAEDGFHPAQYVPYIMRNNRRINLPYPAEYSTSEISEPGYTTQRFYQGCTPSKMSADGKYIYGRLHATGVMWVAVKWTRVGNTNDYTFKEIGQYSDGDLNIWNKLLLTSESGQNYIAYEIVSFLCPQHISGLSPYGKYACGHLGNSMSGGGQLFRYNMEKEELELLNGNGIALYINDDGDLFANNNAVYKGNSTSSITMRQWLQELYGEEIVSQIPMDTGDGNTRVMGSMSADKTTVVLFYDQIKENADRPPVLNSISYIITVEP
jgi:hypothetical protein